MRVTRNDFKHFPHRVSSLFLAVLLLTSGVFAILARRSSPSHVHAATSGLVAAYSFNEGSGTTVADSSGNGNNGTVSGATWTSSGKYGGALSFNGKSSRVVVNDSASLHLSGGMTLEAWVSPTSVPTYWQDVIYKQNDIYFLEAGSSLSKNPPAVGATFSSHGDQFLAGTSTLPANQWTHLAATYDGATLQLYVNGVQVASRAMSDTVTSSSSPLQIGGDSAFGQYFKGIIDEVRVYNRALAPAEIQNDMTVAISQAVLDTQAPTAPSNLTGTSSGPNQINLSWTASTDNVGVTGYLLERCTGSGCTSFAQIATPTTATYSNTGLTASTSYSYRVRATDAAGNLSGYSNIASVATPAAPDTTPPSAPSNFSATPASTTQINLLWTASTDNVGVTGYLLERCLGSGCTTFSQIASPTVTSYSDTGLTASTSYSYRVRATDAAGNLSAYSNVVNVATLSVPDTTPPTAPSSLSATPTSSTQVNLSWAASTDNVGVTGYLLERCVGSGCTSFSQIATPSGTTYGDTGLTPSTSYGYRVRATDAAGNLSSYSNVATVTTPAAVNNPPAAISFVQSSYATPHPSASSVSVPFSKAQIAGDLDLVVVGWNDSSATVTSVGDSSGNVYVLAVGPTQFPGAISQSIYYAKNIHAAGANANVVNVKFSASAVSPDIRILEYSGLDTNSPLDVVAATTGNNSSSATAPAVTTNPSDLIFGANIVVSSTNGPGSGFTQRILTSPDGDIVEDKLVSATGSYSASAPLSSSAAWIMQMVAFKAASGSGTPPPPPTLNSISISPSSPTINVGSTLQFSATGTYSDGSTQNLTAAAAWVSTNTSVATIGSGSGLATGMNAGGSSITATVGSTSSPAANLTVSTSGGGLPSAVDLVQHVSSSNTRGGGGVNNAFASPYCYHFQLPNPTTAGNTIVVGFTFNSNPTPSVHDDKGNAYSVQVNYYDSADTQSIGIATAFNIAAGARVVSVCFSSDPGGYTQPMATEFDNVIGIDGSGTGSKGTGTSVSSGSLTPTVSGDLAYQVAFSLSVNESSFTAGSQSNISWNLLSADLLDGWAAQYGLYNSTAAINPTLSMGTSQKWVSAGILLKTGTSGGVPSGMRIVHLVHENIPYHTNAGGTGNPFPNPTTVQFPSSGNLLVAMIGGGYVACTVTGVSDNNGNAWAQAGPTEIQASNDVTQAFYAGSAATSGNLRLTVHWSATDGDFSFFLYDITGAASSPLDTATGGTGSQSSSGNLTMPYTISPAQAGELVFAEVIWDYNTGAGIVGSGWLFDTNTFDGENQSGPEPIDQNNGWGHYYTTSTSPVTVTWQTMYASLPTGSWSSVAVAFKPAAVVPPPSIAVSVSPSSASVQTGQSLPFTATVQNDPLNADVQWSLSGSGCSSATCGTLTAPSTSSVTFIAPANVPNPPLVTLLATSITDNTKSAPASITIAVNTAIVAPTITAQPANQIVTVGQPATFSLTATGTAPLSYQWQKNSVNISGATAASYTTAATTSSDNGALFDVIVSNAAGSQTSTMATLTVNAVTASAIDVVTYHYDNLRTGQNIHETILTPANVNSTTFGKLGAFTVDGLVDAQPLYLSSVAIPNVGTKNVLYVATEHDSVYAFDADSVKGNTASFLWKVSLVGAGETSSDNRGCSQVTPEIGVTSTPVIDRTRGPHGAIYVVAMSKDANGNYFHRVHALDLTTGAELFGGPTLVQATYPGTGDNSSGGNVVFDAKQYKERPGLLEINGTIYTTWSSHCDARPYTSWVMSYDANTLAQTSVLNLVPNGSEGGIWMAGSAPGADASGNIYFMVGNGDFDTTLNASGFPANANCGQCYVRLSSTAPMTLLDYFTPSNSVSESSSDTDFGSGGPLLLPDLVDGTGTTRHLAVGSGKDAIIYVVDRDNMGKFNSSSDNIYQQITGQIAGVWSKPSYFNNTVYYGAVGDHLKSFPITSAKLAGIPASQSVISFAYPGTTPSISANGTSNGIVWAVENQNGTTGVLHAYNATNLTSELYNSNQAANSRDQFADNKYVTPMVANGKVYIGTTTNVTVFGLLP